MSNLTTPDLGSIITNAIVRKVIYGTYGLATVAYGAVLAYFTTVGLSLPLPLVGVGGVLLFLSIPVTGLAAANTSKTATPVTYVTNVTTPPTPISGGGV